MKTKNLEEEDLVTVKIEETINLDDQYIKEDLTIKCEADSDDEVLSKLLPTYIFQCGKCEKTFPNKSSFISHEILHTDNAFKCDFCGDCFLARATLRGHIMDIHLDIKPHICTSCPETFSRRKYLLSHLKTKHGATSFPCKKCNKKFKSIFLLDCHQKVHKKKKIEKCSHCASSFTTQNKLLHHMMMKHPSVEECTSFARLNGYYVPRYCCQHCGKAYATQANVILHERTHQEKPFICDLCNRTFYEKSMLRVHILARHMGKLPFRCKHCPQSFGRKSNLSKHSSTHSKKKLRLFCTFCGKKFHSKWLFEQHTIRKHLECAPFICAFCEEGFLYKSTLKEHMPDHMGTLPFRCSGCLQLFFTKSDLSEHSEECKFAEDCNFCGKVCKPSNHRENVSKIPLACTECHKEFRSKNLLSMHMRIHTGDKPYQCEICSKCFAFKSNLNAHLRIHSGEKSYICSRCGKAFPYQSGLRRHTVDMVCTDKERMSELPTLLRPKVLSESNPDKKVFSCTRCQKEFYHKSSFNRHNKLCPQRYDINAELNGVSINKYKCEECGRCYKNRSSLSMHKRMHAKKLITCGICSKPFIRKSHYKEHMLSKHSVVKPFRCGYCGQSFHLKHILQRHIRKAHGGPTADVTKFDTFIDNQNNFAYDFTTEIISSYLDAGSGKSHKCKDCGRCYKSKASYDKHITVHSNKAICCNFCGKAFTTKRYHEEHMKKAHPTQPMAVRVTQVEPRKVVVGQVLDTRLITQQIVDARGFVIPRAENRIIDNRIRESSNQIEIRDGRLDHVIDVNNIDPHLIESRTLIHPQQVVEAPHLISRTVDARGVMEHQSVIERQVLESTVIEATPVDGQLNVQIVKRLKCMYCDMSFLKKQDLDQHTESHWSISHPSQSGGAVYATNTTIHVNTSMQDMIPTYTYQPVSSFQTVKTITPYAIPIQQRDYWDEASEAQYAASTIAYETIALETDADNLSLDDGPTGDVIYVIDANPSVEPSPPPPAPPPPPPAAVEPEVKTKPTLTCNDCGKTYASEKSLKSHRLSHAGKTVNCAFCEKAFAPKLLNSHVKNVHMTVKMLKCPICSEYFMKKKMLDEHFKTHNIDDYGNVIDDRDEPQPLLTTPQGIISTEGIIEHPYPYDPNKVQDGQRKKKRKMKKPLVDKPYKCFECGKSYYTRTSLSTHRRVHTGKALCCVFCQKNFIKKHQLKDHVTAVHMKVKNYKCTICDKLFPRNTSLKKHMRAHEPPLVVPPGGNPAKPYQCGECGKAFGSKNYLQEHSKLHTGKGIACDLCGKIFTKEKAVKEHIMAIHTHVRPYKCDFCDRSFTQKSNYNLHVRKHTGEKLRECTFCPKKFTSQAPLRRHLRSHTGQKPFPCPHCSKTFADPSNLKKHITVHTGAKKYTCDICNTGYNIKSSFKNHILTHDPNYKAKPPVVYECPECKEEFKSKNQFMIHKRAHVVSQNQYLCAACGKSFARKISLENHMHTHSDVMPFQCGICDKSFAAKGQLSTHISAHLRKIEAGSKLKIEVIEPLDQDVV